MSFSRALIRHSYRSGGSGHESDVGIKHFSDPLQGPGGWAGGAAFYATDVALVHTTALRQLGQGEPMLLTQGNNLEGDLIGLAKTSL